MFSKIKEVYRAFTVDEITQVLEAAAERQNEILRSRSRWPMIVRVSRHQKASGLKRSIRKYNYDRIIAYGWEGGDFVAHWTYRPFL